MRLSPCGHSVMCSDCAHIAKRCPTCRVSHYHGSSLLVKYSSCTAQPGQHEARMHMYECCPGCALQLHCISLEVPKRHV